MSPGVCRRWHRRLWDGGKLVASQGRNNTALLTDTTTIDTNTTNTIALPSQQSPPPSTPTPPPALVHRSRLICNPIQILGGRSVSLNTFKQDFQVFQGRANDMLCKQMKRMETWPKHSCICYAWRFCNRHLLVSFWQILYQKCFQLSDVLDYVKTGVAAIIEDEVSGILHF